MTIYFQPLLAATVMLGVFLFIAVIAWIAKRTAADHEHYETPAKDDDGSLWPRNSKGL
jgi:hypothetical protein